MSHDEQRRRAWSLTAHRLTNERDQIDARLRDALSDVDRLAETSGARRSAGSRVNPFLDFRKPWRACAHIDQLAPTGHVVPWQPQTLHCDNCLPPMPSSWRERAVCDFCGASEPPMRSRAVYGAGVIVETRSCEDCADRAQATSGGQS